jgi:hypothetical protein
VGELEEAIREHLELKRRRGADPVEVAREEKEALTPVTRSHPVVAAPPPVEARLPGGADEPADGSAVVRRQRGSDDGHDREELDEGPADQLPDDATQEFHVVLGDDWLDDEDDDS